MNQTERSQILHMVDNGQLSVQEAIGLMSSADKADTMSQPIDSQRWLRIRVSNLETGQGKVNVSLPLSWMRLGLAMSSRFVPELDDVDLDAVLQSLEHDTMGPLVQVEDTDDNQRVEVYIE